MEKVNIFDIGFSNFTMQETIIKILDIVKSGNRAIVVTPNVDHIVRIQYDKKLLNIYREADIVLADGMPLLWAGYLLGKPLKQRVSGADLFTRFMSYAAQDKIKIFLLGAKEGVALKAKQILTDKNPGLEIVATYSPPLGFEKDEKENTKIIDMINSSKASVLFAGLGTPKQEYWIADNYKKLNHVKVSIGVGASFDFVAGDVKRAPEIMQKIGLEWFFRLCQEPKRLWRRYLVDDVQFAWIFLKYLFKKEK
ncbi:MAG: teichoic acid biosynthesis [uncultured bacterium]|nr:MAG: teichoic acid biosynthesis [uncultured bacterium]